MRLAISNCLTLQLYELVFRSRDPSMINVMASMGSPFAPICANLFMGYYENQWLNDFKDLRFCFVLDM